MNKPKLKEFLKDWCSVVGPEIMDASGQDMYDKLFEDLYKKHFKQEAWMDRSVMPLNMGMSTEQRKEVYCLLTEACGQIYKLYCNSNDISEQEYTEIIEKIRIVLELKEFKFEPQKSCVYYSIRGKCTHEHYNDCFDADHKNKKHDCLYENQDKCPSSD